jgi:AcrR family transcriptional regulator
MARTRDSALAAARRVFAEVGVRRASMVDISVRAGMAKATLYNHFRTKDDVVSALVLAECRDIVTDALTVRDDPAKALARAAWRCSTHPVLRGALTAEPSLAGTVLTHTSSWDAMQDIVGELLAGVGLSATAAARDLVLRWLVTVALQGSQEAERLLEQGQALAAGLAEADGAG